jgi:hypothetical protein
MPNQRPSKRIQVGQIIQGAQVIERWNNGVYPGGRSYLRFKMKCNICSIDFDVSGEELCCALDGARLTPLCRNRLCSHSVRPVPHGYWQVVSPSKGPPPGRQDREERFWEVRCTAVTPEGNECGNERIKSTSDLTNERASKHCGCLSGRIASDFHASRRPEPQVLLVKKLMKGVKKCCLPKKGRAEIPFSLTLERCSLLYSGSCVYCDAKPFQETNIEVTAGKGRTIHLGRLKHVGLDRVEPKGPYHDSNTVPTCKYCNIFKGRQTIAEFSARLQRIVSRIDANLLGVTVEDKCEQLTRDRVVALERLNRIKTQFCCATYGYITKHLYHAKSAIAAKFDRVFDLTLHQFVLLSQCDCFYCGIEPAGTFRSHTEYGPKRRCDGSCPEVFWYNGIDRVDSREGYTLENIVPCCPACNRAKRDWSVSEFLDHCRMMMSFEENWQKGIDRWTISANDTHV